jgi:hypothetical protein
MVLTGGLMKINYYLLCFFILSIWSFGQNFDNVQVLPFQSKKEMMKYMKKTVSKSLGVKCKYCHNIKDYSDDSNPHKLIAREMMRMVETMNTHLDSAFVVASKAGMKHIPDIPKVDCWMCHHSSTEVEFKKPD